MAITETWEHFWCCSNSQFMWSSHLTSHGILQVRKEVKIKLNPYGQYVPETGRTHTFSFQKHLLTSSPGGNFVAGHAVWICVYLLLWLHRCKALLIRLPTKTTEGVDFLVPALTLSEASRGDVNNIQKLHSSLIPSWLLRGYVEIWYHQHFQVDFFLSISIAS